MMKMYLLKIEHRFSIWKKIFRFKISQNYNDDSTDYVFLMSDKNIDSQSESARLVHPKITILS